MNSTTTPIKKPKQKNFIWEKLKTFDKQGLGMEKRAILAKSDPAIYNQLLVKHQKMKIGDIDFKYIIVYMNVLEVTCQEMQNETLKQQKLYDKTQNIHHV